MELTDEQVYKFYGIKGLEERGIPDKEIVKIVKSDDYNIQKFYNTGWSPERLYESIKEIWGEDPDDLKTIRKKYDEVSKDRYHSIESIMSELEAIIEELDFFGEEPRATQEEIDTLVKPALQIVDKVSLIIGRNYMNRAEKEYNAGKKEKARKNLAQAYCFLTNNSPDEKELEKYLGLKELIG